MANGNQSQMLREHRSKTWLWAVLVIVAALVLLFAWYYYQYGYTTAPATSSGAAPDDTSSIERDLQATNVSDLGAELNDIDKELK